MPMPPSASDWTRFQKLRHVVAYQSTIATAKEQTHHVSPAGCTSCSSRTGVRRDHDQIVGPSRTQREASKWTDFIASQRADFITESAHPATFGSFGKQLSLTKFCHRCSTAKYDTKVGPLKSTTYQHVRLP